MWCFDSAGPWTCLLSANCADEIECTHHGEHARGRGGSKPIIVAERDEMRLDEPISWLGLAVGPFRQSLAAVLVLRPAWNVLTLFAVH